MRRRIATLAILAAMLQPMSALGSDDARRWMLVYTHLNPFYTHVEGGPFQSSSDCYAVVSQESYDPGGTYSCQMIYVQ
jgi:hypothetical protein